MGIFTRIPETSMAGTLGLSLGSASGAVLSPAFTTVSKLKDKVKGIQEALQKGDTSVCQEISSLEQTLDNLDRTLTGLEQNVSNVGNVSLTIQASLLSLQTAATIIKTLPIPQEYMLVSFTVVQSDMLELLMEKIAQIKEISTGISGVTGGITTALSPIRSSIKSIRQSLSTLSVSCALGEEDTNQTNGQGSSNNLSLLVAQLSKIVSDEVKRLGYLVDLQSGLDDIHTALIETLIDAIEPGNYVSIPKDTGDWIATIYTVSRERPQKPSSRTVPPVGWTENEPAGSSWISTATISGKTGQTSTPWSMPTVHSGSGSNIPENEQYSTLVRKWDYDMVNAVTDKTSITGSILYLENSDQAYELLQSILNNLDSEVVSDDLKNKIAEAFDVDGDGGEEQSTFREIIINGVTYLLRILNDPHSPKIATARYVQAVKKSTGERVAVSSPSFAKDNEVLFKDMELILTRMFV